MSKAFIFSCCFFSSTSLKFKQNLPSRAQLSLALERETYTNSLRRDYIYIYVYILFGGLSHEELLGECLYPLHASSPHILKIFLRRVLPLFLGTWYQDHDVVFHVRCNPSSLMFWRACVISNFENSAYIHVHTHTYTTHISLHRVYTHIYNKCSTSSFQNCGFEI